jgi:hypothetical protein
VLAILSLRAKGERPADAHWRSLFSVEPYQQLKSREAEIGKRFNDPTRAFTDEDFRRFVLSEDLRSRAADLA